MPGENFPGDRIVSLVDELEGLIEEAKPPFGKNAQFKVIDADVFFNILDEIRMSYPEEGCYCAHLIYWDQKWNRRISGSVWNGCHCLYLFQDFFQKYFQTLSGESEVSSDDG